MRFEEVETMREKISDGQTGIAAGNVSPTYGKSHCAGRFLDSASLRSK